MHINLGKRMHSADSAICEFYRFTVIMLKSVGKESSKFARFRLCSHYFCSVHFKGGILFSISQVVYFLYL